MSYPHHSYPHHYHFPYPGRASYSTVITSLGPGFSLTRLQADLSSVRSQHVIATLHRSFSILLIVSSFLLFTFLLLLPPIDAVTPSRKNTAEEYRMMMQDRALLNLNLMNTIGKCRDPRPLVVYPPATPNKIFHPRGTVSVAISYLNFKKINKFCCFIIKLVDCAPVQRYDRMLYQSRRSVPPAYSANIRKSFLCKHLHGWTAFWQGHATFLGTQS